MKDLTDDPEQNEFFISKNQDHFAPKFEKLALNRLTELDQKSLDSVWRNKIIMKKFLDVSKQSKSCDLGVKDCFPEGAPIGFHLKTDISLNNLSWDHPNEDEVNTVLSSRSISKASLNTIEVMEIEVGTSSSYDIKAAVDFLKENTKKDRKAFYNVLLATEIQEVEIDKSSFEIACTQRDNYKKCGQVFSTPILGTGSKNSCKFPVRMVVGNGRTWMLSIRISALERFDVKEKKMILDVKFQDCKSDEASLFKEWISIVGFDILRSRDGFFETLSIVSGLTFEPVQGVNIEVLAAVAGYSGQIDNPAVVNLQVTGGFFPKSAVSYRGWTQPWKMLPDETKIFIIGGLRSAFNVHVILVSIIQRHFFPDPDVVCNLLKCSHGAFPLWFSGYLGSACCEQNISMDKVKIAKVRKELNRCCIPHIPHSSTSPLDGYDKKKAQALIKLTPPWPTVVYGGARYLHMVREYFVTKQFFVLKVSVDNRAGKLDFCREITPYLKQKLLFGRLTTSLPGGRGTEQEGLCAHSELSPSVLDIDPQTVLQVDLHKHAKLTNQTSSDVLREWARFNPSKIDVLLRRMDKKRPEGVLKFWVDKTSIYEDLRLIYQTVLNEPAYVVEHLDQSAFEKYFHTCEKFESMQKKSDKLFKDTVERNKIVRQLEKRFPNTSRSGLEQEAYAMVPGPNAARNRRKKEAKKRRTQDKRARKLDAKKKKSRTDKNPSTTTPPDNSSEDGGLVDDNEIRTVRFVGSPRDDSDDDSKSPPRKVQFITVH